jgi:myo-inositol-1(or 4)-monophosphatase
MYMNLENEILNTAIALARKAGLTLLESNGDVQVLSKKGDNSNIVTAADAASEAIIVHGVRQKYPDHSIIAEETGCDLRGSEFTWVIDPLDGTSNYAAGIPWFGVLIAVLQGKKPVAAVIHIPSTGDVYSAQAGRGAFKNDEPIFVAHNDMLADVLWAYGMDGGSTDEEAERNTYLLSKLLRRVRNIRATNSLMDPAYTAEGRLGGMLNQSTRLWDIAAPMLIVQEAGGLYTDLTGQQLDLDISESAADKEYAVLAGAPQLHSEVAALVRETRLHCKTDHAGGVISFY